MRTMLKVSLPVENGNTAIRDGSMPRILETLMEQIKPEAAYFYVENGRRTAIFVFDMGDSARMPPVLEPLFMQLHAEVTLTPVMNAEDLRNGLGQFVKGT